jgi:hypothetical protein
MEMGSIAHIAAFLPPFAAYREYANAKVTATARKIMIALQ